MAPMRIIATVTAGFGHVDTLNTGGYLQRVAARRQWQCIDMVVLTKCKVLIVGRDFVAPKVLADRVRTWRLAVQINADQRLAVFAAPGHIEPVVACAEVRVGTIGSNQSCHTPIGRNGEHAGLHRPVGRRQEAAAVCGEYD